MSGFRYLQPNYSGTYGGEYPHDAAHYNSVKELEYFGVSERNYHDHASNYRNVHAMTNKSEHNQIDNELMRLHAARAQQGNSISYQYSGVYGGGKTHNCYVSNQQIQARLVNKINAAKQTGAMDNARYQNYLYKSAERYGCDMRMFNGW